MELSMEVMDILSNKTQFYTSDSNEIRFGRNSSHEISINNKYISDTHATLFNSDNNFYIRDENSSNGSEIYTNYKWEKLGNKKKLVKLPIQLKLAEAVIITIQSGESQIISLSEIGNDAAIMVLDLCNSTNQAVNNEQIAFHLKQRLNSIAKPILYSTSVNFYKNTGDGFLATFPKTTQAVNTAIKILKTLEKRNKKTDNPPINVRIGLHKGKTYVIDPATEDIHGMDINITFRIEGLKKIAFKNLKTQINENNRILGSKSFYDDYKKKSRRKTDIFESCGFAKLKGIKERMEIYRVNWK